MTSTPFSVPSDTPSGPPPAALPPAPRPQLRRARTGALLGGVSGGLADHTGTDAVLWRVGFVALTLAGGSGVLLYLLLWVLLPQVPPVPGEQVRPVDGFVDRLQGRLSGTTAPRG